MREIPENYDSEKTEAKWRDAWESMRLYAYDPTKNRDETFVIDTPPPTVSGSLHLGHVFSYTHQDLVARYQRMRGKNLNYGMGWDDNGLPTERRVQNVFGIKCNAKLPYVPGWAPATEKPEGAPAEEVSRRNFIEACARLTAEDESAFESLWRRMGLSLDWSQTYATIDAHCRRISQLSFLDLVEKGQCYSKTAPTIWDVDFKTAVAQAELEDKEQDGAMHDIRFALADGGEVTIATTRPELIAACIALVAHPEDARYQGLFGKKAVTPLFGAEVPILPAEHADPEKGTGMLMICTFGDGQDAEFWKKSGLAAKQIVGLDGHLLPVDFKATPFLSRRPEIAAAFYGEISGLYTKKARGKMAELLGRDGSGPNGQGTALAGQPKPVKQMVKYYEKGSRPVEYVTSRQWFVKILEHRAALIEQGKKIEWHPAHMRSRYENWVDGLNQDWCISRQRYFGVPFPVWYPLDQNGEPLYDRPIYASKASLPADPLADCPPGFEESQRGKAMGFMGDPDVMDTWATSSLTPQITGRWTEDPARHKKLFPMDMRPQSHEIIRTWAFYTIVKAWMHEREIPWKHVVISGWILDPDRKKMSKSKGNVVTPGHLLDQHSVDGVRYWAGRARLGADTAFDETVFKVGKRLATKVFNAGRFVLLQLDRVTGGKAAPGPEAITDPLDRAFIARLAKVVEDATKSFDEFDYAGALQASEQAFWEFCDHYLELVKTRSYEETDTPGRRSAMATLSLGLSTFLRLLAPFIPYVTEEVWSWRFACDGRLRSVHTSPWPTATETAAVSTPAEGDVYGGAIEALSKIRGSKTDAKKSLKQPVTKLEITGSAENLAALDPVLTDVLLAGVVDPSAVVKSIGAAAPGEKFKIVVTL